MKAITVIDEMPKSCRECTLRASLGANKFHCMAILPRKEIEPYKEQIPSWCPLRPMPEQMSWGHTADYIEGYNACLDEIMGETE